MLGFDPAFEGPRPWGPALAGQTFSHPSVQEEPLALSPSTRDLEAHSAPPMAPLTHPDWEAACALAHSVLVCLPLVGGAKPRARRLVSAVSGSAVTYSWCPPLLVTQDRGTGQGRWLEAWVPAGWIECSGNMGSHNMGSGLQWRGGVTGSEGMPFRGHREGRVMPE